MTNLLADVRLALRSWRKAPGFASIAILSIALGIGANAAIFTLVDQVLLRVLPVRDSHELVQVTFTGSRYGNNWGDGSELSYPVYKEIRDNNQVFAGVFARFGYGVSRRRGGSHGTGRRRSRLGERTFRCWALVLRSGERYAEDDDRVPGGHPIAVLSHGFWIEPLRIRSRRHGNSSLSINGHPYSVVGVAQKGFDGMEVGRQTQVFVPMMMKAQITPTWNALDDRLCRWVKVFARLRPGDQTGTGARGRSSRSSSPCSSAISRIPISRRAAPETRQRYQDNRLSLPRSVARPIRAPPDADNAVCGC